MSLCLKDIIAAVAAFNEEEILQQNLTGEPELSVSPGPPTSPMS